MADRHRGRVGAPKQPFPAASGSSLSDTTKRRWDSLWSVSPAGAAEGPRCPQHRDTRMVPSVVELRFSGHSIAARGWKCPRCDEWAVSADELADAQSYARRMGFFPEREP